MSSFVRPADWLRQLFTQSRTEPSNPSRVSEDVSLVQPFDGSGWGMVMPDQIVSETPNPAAASGVLLLRTTGKRNIGRILAASVELFAGVTPGHIGISMRLAGAMGVNDEVGIAVPLTTFGGAIMKNGFNITSPIIPPDFEVLGTWAGGDAATVLIFQLALVEVPLGTVFYV